MNWSWLWSWLPSVTWKKPDVALQDKIISLSKYALELENINKGLVNALGNAVGQIENLRHEALALLSAVAFQANGELIIKEEFFAALAEEGQNLILKVEKSAENGNITLRLVAEEEHEENI